MKVRYLVEVNVDPMKRLDMGWQAQQIKSALLGSFAILTPEDVEITAPMDPWGMIGEGDKGELIKLVLKAIRHGFGDHPEKITDMGALTGSIAKRLAGELWARRK